MPLSSEEYDKLTPEERDEYEASERARERQEQAGMPHRRPSFILLVLPFWSLICCPWVIALPYRWSQQLFDVDITVPVPKGTRARDLAITITKKKLSVGLKGQEPIMAGDLCQDIKEEDSTWTVGE